MSRLIDHAFIFSTIFFTTYSQLVMRWQVAKAGPLPASFIDKSIFVGSLLINPWILTGIAATFLAGVSWMLVMTKFDISYAFPFVSLNYIIIMGAGFILFQEAISPTKLIGSCLVVLGIIIIAKG